MNGAIEIGDVEGFLEEAAGAGFAGFAFGGAAAGECLRHGLADEVRYSILPIVIGEGIAFFEKLDKDVALHLTEVKAYKSGMVALCYDVK